MGSLVATVALVVTGAATVVATTLDDGTALVGAALDRLTDALGLVRAGAADVTAVLAGDKLVVCVALGRRAVVVFDGLTIALMIPTTMSRPATDPRTMPIVRTV